MKIFIKNKYEMIKNSFIISVKLFVLKEIMVDSVDVRGYVEY